MLLSAQERQAMIERIVDWDVRCIEEELAAGRADTLRRMAMGVDWTPYSHLTDDQVKACYRARFGAAKPHETGALH
jgi:hypothetical protein